MALEDTYGGRLRIARTEAGFKSAESFVAEINKHLEVQGYNPVAVGTYRKWEKIGTPSEDKSMTAFPHPIIYPIWHGLTGVTAYWLWYGTAGGKIVKRIADLPPENRKVIDQQLATISCPHKLSLIEHFTRAVAKFTDRQRKALEAFLRLL